MGKLVFAINVTLDGCCDHREGLPDEELHQYFNRLMDESDAMLFGRVTYELMESAWPAILREGKAPGPMLEFARKIDEKRKYVLSNTRKDFPWNNTTRLQGELRSEIARLKREHRQILAGSPSLATQLATEGLFDEFRLVIQPIIAGHGPRLFERLPSRLALKRVELQPLRSGVVAATYLPA